MQSISCVQPQRGSNRATFNAQTREIHAEHESVSWRLLHDPLKACSDLMDTSCMMQQLSLSQMSGCSSPPQLPHSEDAWSAGVPAGHCPDGLSDQCDSHIVRQCINDKPGVATSATLDL